MTDILKDTPAYHWMTEDAREEGREQGIERGREQERQAAQETMLNQLREMTMEIIIGRFPKFVRLAKKQVRDAKDLGRLQRALVKVSLAHDDDDIEPYLWEIDEEEDQTVH